MIGFDPKALDEVEVQTVSGSWAKGLQWFGLKRGPARKPTHVMIAALVFSLAAGAGTGHSSTSAAAVQDQARDPTRPESRIDRLEAWLAAVERHEPGTADEPAVSVRLWPRADLQELAADLSVVVRLIDDPQYDVLWQVEPLRLRPRRTSYSRADERRLRGFAREAAERGGQNRFLKRGAVLHTDAAMLVEIEASSSRGVESPRPDRVIVPFGDGRQLGMEGTSGHWELAETLLDAVAPDPALDDTVRLWHIATLAYRQRHEQLDTWHADRAARLLPNTAEVLFFGGSLHEAFASPRLRSLFSSVSLPAGVSFGAGSVRSELAEAEALFRRSVELKPDYTEARLRLGRVLGQLGRHDEAARELRQVVGALSTEAATRSATADTRLLRYYAELFLGTEAEALDDRELARASYTRAAALYPDAQSARLALSQLALHSNDRAAALEAVRQTLVLPEGDGGRDDPWWSYHVFQGRAADAWFDELYRSLPPGDVRAQP